MRTDLFFSAIIAVAALLGAQTLTAQNTSSYWSLEGNSNASSASRLGTTNAAPLNLLTSNATRLYIDAAGNVGIGTTTPAQRLHVLGHTLVEGSIGIGTATPSQKLHVEGSTYVSGNLGVGTAVAPHYKLAVEGNTYTTVAAIAGFSGNIGIHGRGTNFGIFGESSFAGIYGVGINSGVYGFSNSYGVQGYSTDGVGGYFHSNTSHGLFATTVRSDISYAAVFQGHVYTTGVYSSSDKSLKKNTEEFDHAMSIINKLRPKSYEFRQDGKYAALHLPLGKHYGLLAQEVEEVLPGLVKETALPLVESPESMPQTNLDVNLASSLPVLRKENPSETVRIKAVNYTELIPILVKALQEQDQKIEQQQQQISDLKQLVNKLTSGQTTNTSLVNGALLQNIPNPVKGSTSISYSLPDGTGRAQLVVTDAMGRTIKTLQLTQSGTINFDVSSLSSGVYNYSLVVDNQIVQTRKMTVKR